MRPLTIIAVGLGLFFLLSRLGPRKRTKEQEEAELTKAGAALANKATVLNNSRQIPLSYLGELPLQFASASPLDNSNPTTRPGDTQILPRLAGSEQFSTVFRTFIPWERMFPQVDRSSLTNIFTQPSALTKDA